VSERQILLPGQHLEFVRQAGEKGDRTSGLSVTGKAEPLLRTTAPWAM